MITPLRQQMHQDLQLAGLSERTQEAYLRAVRQLAAHFRQAPDQLTETQLREYLLYLKNDKQFAPSSLIVAACGIKFFYTHTAPRDWKTLQKLRVPRAKTLPDVLTIDEVRRLIDAVRTPHNQTYFWTVYSLGLRLQEGLNLQVGDIDGARMLVHVHHGKGAKDCSAPLKSDHRNDDLLSDPSLRSLCGDPLLLELARRQVPQRRVNPLPVVHIIEELPQLPPGIGEVLVF
jgi:integrase/recombinase XerD